MFGFKKKDEDNGIIILNKTRPNECGGTDATLDTKAPTQILSNEMILFNVTSKLGFIINEPMNRFDFISAFAIPAKSGTFLFLEIRGNESFQKWALVKNDIFAELAALVNSHEIAKNNGLCAKTHGLPDNFGGTIDITYASGEKIYISDNRAPIIGIETANEILKIFTSAMNNECVSLPDISTLKQIRFYEYTKEDDYSEAVLTILDDGTGINKKRAQYEDAQIFESESQVDKETIDAIKKNISNCGMLAWENIPVLRKKSFGSSKTETFIFDGDIAIEITEHIDLPYQISRGFFNIELELTTKH